MVNYQNAKIYKIQSLSAGLDYYGATCEGLSSRMAKHRSHKKRHDADSKKMNYITSFFVLEHPDAKIILVEKFPCENKEELAARENFYITTNKCVNKVLPNRTKKEWYEDNKEKMRAKKHEWYEDHKDEILAKKREKYENSKDEKHKCECGGQYTTGNKSYHMKTKKHQTWLDSQ